MSDRDLKVGTITGGSSLEEMWFYRRNRELIDGLKEKERADETRPRDRSHLRLIQGGLQEPQEPRASPDPQLIVKKSA